MSTCNRLDLQILETPPIMLKNLPIIVDKSIFHAPTQSTPYKAAVVCLNTGIKASLWRSI
jgi:hypothetical protein